jgi:hypothetical protein
MTLLLEKFLLALTQRQYYPYPANLLNFVTAALV